MKRFADISAEDQNGGGQKRRPLDDSSLQEAIKVGQRASSEWKEAWRHWCDTEGNAIYDPVKHSAEFLKSFFRTMGNLYAKDLQQNPPVREIRTEPANNKRNEKRSTHKFVTHVVNLPRQHGAMMNQHRERSEPRRPHLDQSKDSHGRPGQTSVNATTAAPETIRDLEDMIKAGQRSNNTWKELWSEFCTENGNGMNDPKKHAHNPAFFIAFCFRFGLSTIGREDWAQQYLPAISKTAMPIIVDAIKQGQRSSTEWKERWSEFCAQQGSQFMDPSRHDAASLLQFIDTIALTDFEHEMWMQPFVTGGGQHTGGPPLSQGKR